MLMIRWLLWILAGVLLGGIVHLATVLVLPRTAIQDAYARLSPVTPVNAFGLLPEPSSGSVLMPFVDPAFAVAVCRYDLAPGPMKLVVPVSPAYTSVTFYTRQGVAFYAINDRAAGRRSIELDLMTTQQRNDLPDEEDMTAADRLIIESPTMTGMIVARALSSEPGQMAQARRSLEGAQCRAQ
jgi:uncharacterized membrane protein